MPAMMHSSSRQHMVIIAEIRLAVHHVCCHAGYSVSPMLLIPFFLSFFLSAPNFRGRSVDRHHILKDVRWRPDTCMMSLSLYGTWHIIHQRAMILFIQTLALYKSFIYLLTYLLTYLLIFYLLTVYRHTLYVRWPSIKRLWDGEAPVSMPRRPRRTGKSINS